MVIFSIILSSFISFVIGFFLCALLTMTKVEELERALDEALAADEEDEE